MEPEGSSPHSQAHATCPYTEFCIQRKHLAYVFRNKDSLRRGVVSTLPKLQDGEPPRVGCPRLLIQYTRSCPPNWRPFLHPQPKEAPCRGDRDPLITWQDALYRLIYYSKSAVHVSGDVFAHRQEHLTVFTISGSVHPSCCRLVSWMSWNAGRVLCDLETSALRRRWSEMVCCSTAKLYLVYLFIYLLNDTDSISDYVDGKEAIVSCFELMI